MVASIFDHIGTIILVLLVLFVVYVVGITIYYLYNRKYNREAQDRQLNEFIRREEELSAIRKQAKAERRYKQQQWDRYVLRKEYFADGPQNCSTCKRRGTYDCPNRNSGRLESLSTCEDYLPS